MTNVFVGKLRSALIHYQSNMLMIHCAERINFKTCKHSNCKRNKQSIDTKCNEKKVNNTLIKLFNKNETSLIVDKENVKDDEKEKNNFIDNYNEYGKCGNILHMDTNKSKNDVGINNQPKRVKDRTSLGTVFAHKKELYNNSILVQFLDFTSHLYHNSPIGLSSFSFLELIDFITPLIVNTLKKIVNDFKDFDNKKEIYAGLLIAYMYLIRIIKNKNAYFENIGISDVNAFKSQLLLFIKNHHFFNSKFVINNPIITKTVLIDKIIFKSASYNSIYLNEVYKEYVKKNDILVDDFIKALKEIISFTEYSKSVDFDAFDDKTNVLLNRENKRIEKLENNENDCKDGNKIEMNNIIIESCKTKIADTVIFENNDIFDHFSNFFNHQLTIMHDIFLRNTLHSRGNLIKIIFSFFNEKVKNKLKGNKSFLQNVKLFIYEILKNEFVHKEVLLEMEKYDWIQNYDTIENNEGDTFNINTVILSICLFNSIDNFFHILMKKINFNELKIIIKHINGIIKESNLCKHASVDVIINSLKAQIDLILFMFKKIEKKFLIRFLKFNMENIICLIENINFYLFTNKNDKFINFISSIYNKELKEIIEITFKLEKLLSKEEDISKKKGKKKIMKNNNIKILKRKMIEVIRENEGIIDNNVYWLLRDKGITFE